MTATTPTRHRVGYWTTAATYLALQAFTTLPSPLYAAYAARDHLGPLTITLVYAAYAAGVAVSLVFVGHLSDVFGRRPVLAVALAVDAVSALVFILWPSLPGLFTARVLCGLAVGVTASTATAYLTELFLAHRPREHMSRLQLLSTAVSIGGLGVGPLVAALAVETFGAPLVSPYLTMLVVFVICGAALVWAPETRERVIPRPPYRPQRLSVPAHSRRTYAAALAGVATVFAVFGLFIGLAGTILSEGLGRVSITTTGVLLFVIFASGVASVSVTLRRPHRTQIISAGASMLVGLGVLVAAGWSTSLADVAFVAIFLAAGLLIGSGGSTLFAVSLASASAVAPPERRAETLAGFFLAGYVALSVPVIGVGLGVQAFGLRPTLVGFCAVAAVTSAWALSGLLTPPSAVRVTER